MHPNWSGWETFSRSTIYQMGLIYKYKRVNIHDQVIEVVYMRRTIISVDGTPNRKYDSDFAMKYHQYSIMKQLNNIRIKAPLELIKSVGKMFVKWDE